MDQSVDRPNELHAEELELEDMVADERHQRSSMKNRRKKTESWSSRTLLTPQMKVVYTVLVLAVIVGASIGLLMSHRGSTANEAINDREQVGATDEQNDYFDELTGSEAMSPLRSYAGHDRSRSYERLGHMSIYIQKDKRRSPQRERFPVAHYTKRHNPFRGALLSFMPRIPVFADRFTRQTLIFSQTGGVYILPPVINTYGKMFSVAELIASGYASLVSSGVPPPANIDMLRFFLPQPLIGPAIPTINPYTGVFRGGVRSDIGSFPGLEGRETRPRADYSPESEEEDDDRYDDQNDDRRSRPDRYDDENDDDENDDDRRYRPDRYGSNSDPYYKRRKYTKKTTTTTEAPEPGEPIITKCDPVTNPNGAHGPRLARSAGGKKEYLAKRLEAIKNKHAKAGSTLQNTYVVRFGTPDAQQTPFEKVQQTMSTNDLTRSLSVTKRVEFDTKFFYGVSFTVNDQEAVKALANHDDIIDIYSVSLYTQSKLANCTTSSKTGGSNDLQSIIPHQLTGVSKVHKELNNYGKGVRIAVVDDGIDYNHPALGECYKTPGCRIADGYDFVGDAYDGTNDRVPDDDPLDSCPYGGHGTHVAGIIAANAIDVKNDDPFYKPITPFTGVAPEATLLIYRVFGCAGVTASDVVLDAVLRAIADDADIVTLSLGDIDPFPEELHSIAVEIASNAGVYVTVASGNAGLDGVLTSGVPAIAPNAISVASVDNAYTLEYPIVTPDGKKIYYQAQRSFTIGESTFQSKIVVNDPNPTVNDGCDGSKKTATGTVVLFAFSSDDTCTFSDRCAKAVAQGATGCLLDTPFPELDPPTNRQGIISKTSRLQIAAIVAKDPNTIFQFPDVVEARPVRTALTPSLFTSMGLTAELDFKPDIGAIGGYVYSTISTALAKNGNFPTAYAVFSGTGMACPYMAGVLALFLAQIGNPAPTTVDGYSQSGKCRPKASLVRDVFQSTTTLLKQYDTTLIASTIRQGAGLVDAYRGITTNAFFSPGKLALKDTVRQSSSYTVQLYNMDSQTARFKLSHQGAALVTGKEPDNDLLLRFPKYTADYADVQMEPKEFEVRPGKSKTITLRFQAPTGADKSLLPLYSGYVVAKNQDTGEQIRLPYAGVVGDYGEARMFVQKTPSGIITGIKNTDGTYVDDTTIPTISGTAGAQIVLVLAYATRICYIDAIPGKDDILLGYDINYGLLTNSESFFYFPNVPRNGEDKVLKRYAASYTFSWNGNVFQYYDSADIPSTTNEPLPAGQYRIRFTALKNFGDSRNRNDFEVYVTPPFNLVP